jgi:hypothetical protein
MCRPTATLITSQKLGANYKFAVFVLVFYSGGAAIAIAVLNSKTFVLTSTYCTVIGDPDYSGCGEANITLAGSATGFWDLWVEDEIAIIRSVLVS